MKRNLVKEVHAERERLGYESEPALVVTVNFGTWPPPFSAHVWVLPSMEEEMAGHHDVCTRWYRHVEVFGHEPRKVIGSVRGLRRLGDLGPV